MSHPARSLRFPAPRLAILLAGALLLALAAPAAPAGADERPTLGLRYPSLTPDGQQVVFGYRGDIWVAARSGEGVARRLTIHEAQDTLPRVSPDGTMVAFSSRRGGGYDIYVVPIEGGMPRQVTFHGGPEILCDWSPDGKRLLFLASRHPNRHGLDLYEAALDGGTPRRVTLEGGRDGCYAPDGKAVVYANGTNTIYQDDYEGSGNYDLHVVDEPGALPRVLTQTDRNERYPFFSADGETIYFVAEVEGVANFFARPAVAEGEARQLTDFEDDVWRPDLGWDGRTAVFERAGRLYTIDLAAEKPQAEPIELVIESDVRHSGVEVRDVSDGAENVDVRRDGQAIVFAAHGDLWTMPTSGGEARRLTSTPETEAWPRWRPDGRAIAYQVESGENTDIHLLELDGGKRTQLTRHAKPDFFHSWSPDGRHLAFSSERSGNRDIWVLEVATGDLRQVTRHPAGDDDPAFSPDGRFIAFDSAREGTQAIFVVPVEGGTARRVSGGSGFMQVPTWSPDGRMIAFEAFNPANGSSGGIHVVSADGGPQVQVSRDGTGACWSPAGDWIYFTAERGSNGSQIYRVPAPDGIEAGERVPFLGKIEVEVRDELGDLFDEAWQKLRDNFYDPKMHGVDWEAVRKRYRPIAVDTENKDEFHNVIRQMLAELGASHLGISGGQRPHGTVEPEAEQTGELGLVFDPDSMEEAGWKVASLIRGGPADQAGLRVGDVVLAIGKHELKAGTNLDRVLAGTAGRELSVTFRPITADGLGPQRKLDVRPARRRDLDQILHRQWVRRNARRVQEGTEGRAGYIHLDRMDGSNLQRFQRAVAQWNQRDKVQGMVLDVRNNGGGNIHVQLMDILTSRPFMQVVPRGARGPIVQPQYYWEGPVVVLINERSFSDAEVFPYAFKTLERGKVVGVPTPGGVIGTTDIRLADGSRFRIPRTGLRGMDGTNLEGHGVKPDIHVVITPADERAGRDPQLAKAIEVILDELGATTPQAPETTPTAEPEAPSPAPETPGPVAVGSALDPLADVREGEWVRYRAGHGEGETLLLVTVVEADAEHVRFERRVEQGGGALPPLPDEIPRGPVLDVLPALAEVAAHEEGRAEVDGTEVDVLRVTLEQGGMRLDLVFTDAVAGMGLWRVELGGQIVLEAVAWGHGPVPAADEEDEDPSSEASASVGARAADASSGVPDPLYDAEPGEWVRMRQQAPEGETLVTLRVVEVRADQVVLRSTVERDGEREAGAVILRPRLEVLPLTGRRQGRPLRVEEETVEIAGQPLRCVVLVSEGRRGTLKRYYAAEVPGTGLVRVERDGRILREAVAWGRDAPDEDGAGDGSR